MSEIAQLPMRRGFKIVPSSTPTNSNRRHLTIESVIAPALADGEHLEQRTFEGISCRHVDRIIAGDETTEPGFDSR